jgi:hypothetical protein
MSRNKDDNWIAIWTLASIYSAKQIEAEYVVKPYKKFEFSERLTRYKNLYQIIERGDFLNRAIFTEDELLKGITRLLKAGLIEEKAGILLVTNKVKKIYEEATSKREDVSIKEALQVFRMMLQTESP